MNECLRLERVKAKITIISIKGPGIEGLINFTSEDHMKRFADFEWKDETGNPSFVFRRICKAFEGDKWIILVLERRDSGRDRVKVVE